MSVRPAPLTGQRAWIGAGLVVVAVVSGLWTLSTLVLPGPWRAISVGAVLLLAASTTALRQRTRSRTAPSAWGVGLAVVMLGALYAGRGTTPSLPLPTPETVERFARLARSGITAITDGSIPMEPVRGVELLM
ncbi:MAG: transglutaminase protein, partial [Actinotalea sp.]|nr:transglutaminase protein [Actinotalea sp.]